ncbi:MAG TPA: ATP-dependent DNA helicase RecQ [Tepidisphaeraceae bacterium]|jgi:ATP-dependent DNA helicase RecQ|nr:ATP-dependent DNA helicase RecQ [Tepidisphaeraceae bacterium]
MPVDIDTPTASDVLRDVFGFNTFREGQQAVVDRLLAGRSVLAIFPTGAGKSLCYQLPALMLDGVTLVVSPLIALMKDQIDFLVRKGVAAARSDSSVSTAEAGETFRRLRDGSLKLLYIAPERLANERFLNTLSRLNIALMAVDEAHCISEWGHNFRPDYLKLAPLAKRLGIPRVLALTATATPPVAKQIAAAFGIEPSDVVQTGFYRPNLSLVVSPSTDGERAHTLLKRLRTRPPGPTIVYVTLQRTAETLATFLAENGIDAVAYHAGLDADVRHAIQDTFMASAGQVVVATIAFGMGIDKRDIRYVYHFNLPKSLENYAQEIGRAGRDGKESICEMFACISDRVTLENFTFGDTPTSEAIAGILKTVLTAGEQFDVSTYELSNANDTRPLVVETLLTYLQLDGYIESTGPFYTEYKFQHAWPLADIFAGYDADRAAFLRDIFGRARKLKTWSVLDVHQIALDLGQPRERIVAAITYLEERGDLVVQVGGIRQGYRRLQTITDGRPLTKTMSDRFHTREVRDVERLDEVTKFASHQGCKTRRLLTYFGEPTEADCGHCGWCRGHRPGGLPTPVPTEPTTAERQSLRQLQSERHSALSTPRQLARFLCGIPSPGASRAKLTKDRRFGSWSGVPFRDVLAMVTE